MAIDTALKAFEKIKSDVSALGAVIQTEQEARFQIIDRTLVEVLGWSRDDIRLENRAHEGYIDYLMHSGGQNRLVVEAKRTSTLLVDTAHPGMRAYKLNGPAVKSAQSGIEQARDYCLDKGTPFAALTTGMVWIVFLAYRSDGKPVSESRAIVFPSLEAVRSDFAIFYDLLSKAAVCSKTNLVQMNRIEGLRIEHDVPLYAPVDPNKIVRQRKNELAIALEKILDEFFAEMTGDKDHSMLAECFVETKESAEADAALDRIAREFFADIEAFQGEADEQLEREIQAAVELKKGESIVLIGNKGAGKTTFVERFFSRVLDPTLRKKCLLVTVDM